MRSAAAIRFLFAGLVLAVLGACGGGAASPRNDVGDVGGDPTGDALAVFVRVNEEREAAGVPPLGWHEPAAGVALAHSVDMDVRDFFDHVNPDGQDPGDRLTAAGIPWVAYGENIARGQPTPDAVMDAWMSSSGHRSNILNPVFTHVGVGVHEGPDGPWWTQVFLTPP